MPTQLNSTVELRRRCVLAFTDLGHTHCQDRSATPLRLLLCPLVPRKHPSRDSDSLSDLETECWHHTVMVSQEVFTGGMLFLPPNQQHQSTDAHDQVYSTRKASCRLQTRATLAKRLHGLCKSSGVVSCMASLPIDSLPMVSYYRPIVTLCLKCIVFDIITRYWSKIAEKPTSPSFGTFLWGDPL